MKYEELDSLLGDAWQAFFDVLCDNADIDENKLRKSLNYKDCFNGVENAVMDVVSLEYED